MILVIKWQRTCLNCVHILCFVEVELASDEIGYLAKAISKQKKKKRCDLAPSVYSKM